MLAFQLGKGAIMTDNVRDEEGRRAERRAFLEQCGRFSVVTPPVVTLMLAVSGNTAALATSAKTTTTTTTTPTTTTTATTTTKHTTTNHTTTTKTIILSSITRSMNLHQPEPTERLAMMIDSLGLMKL